jgi:hypothetical protein
MQVTESDYEERKVLGEARKVIKEEAVERARNELHNKEVEEANGDPIKLWKAHLKWTLKVPALFWLKEVMLQQGLNIYGESVTENYKIAINEIDGTVGYV